MNLRRRCGLVSRGTQGHAVFSRFRVAPHRVLRGWCVERRRQRRRYDPGDEREQPVPILWRGFEPGPQSISSPFGGLADRRAARRADAPGETLPLRGGSMRAAHLRRTLQRQHPQALGAPHGSTRSDRPLFGACPWRSAGGEFRAPLEHTGQQRHPVARRAQTGRPELRAPVIIGVDDWAWRRDRRHGTLICDLERRKTIALLPNRKPATAEAWLGGQPQIAVVARDRGGGYAMAAQKVPPNAVTQAGTGRGIWRRQHYIACLDRPVCRVTRCR